MPEFEVVVDALIDAATGVTNTVADLRMAPVRLLDPGAEAIGHRDLAAAVTDFCTRWQAGVAHLVDDSDQFVVRLRQAASAYVGVDVVVAGALRADSP